VIQFFLIIIFILAAGCAILFMIAKTQVKRADRAEAEAKALHDAFRQVKEKAGRLQKALGETAKTEEEADGKRRELNQIPDSGLADRANALFGVRDGKARPGSSGNTGPV
jgi:type II secretory pathway pseudopilin PulG